MAKINQKYLKDENNEIFSPVTSIGSVYDNNGTSLKDMLSYSKEETIKGIWYDGSILYRKVIEVTSGIDTSGNIAKISLNIPNLRRLFMENAFFGVASSNTFNQFNYSWQNQGDAVLYWNNSCIGYRCPYPNVTILIFIVNYLKTN